MRVKWLCNSVNFHFINENCNPLLKPYVSIEFNTVFFHFSGMHSASLGVWHLHWIPLYKWVTLADWFFPGSWTFLHPLCPTVFSPKVEWWFSVICFSLSAPVWCVAPGSQARSHHNPEGIALKLLNDHSTTEFLFTAVNILTYFVVN